MLQTLISCTQVDLDVIPPLILMSPIQAKGFVAKAKSHKYKEMCFLFICPVTKKPAKSGPDGTGYRITVTREWVKKAAPLLVIALKITQLALTAYGMPFPFPSLPLDFTFDTYLGNFRI
jgi:hypothetical protein